jgi:hypothetical protein
MQFQDRYKSYLALKPPDNIASTLDISLEIRPTSPHGYLAYFKLSKTFVHLAIKRSYLVLTFNLGSGTTVVKSKTKLRMKGKWYAVIVSRSGKIGGTKFHGKTSIFTVI